MFGGCWSFSCSDDVGWADLGTGDEILGARARMQGY